MNHSQTSFNSKSCLWCIVCCFCGMVRSFVKIDFKFPKVLFYLFFGVPFLVW